MEGRSEPGPVFFNPIEKELPHLIYLCYGESTESSKDISFTVPDKISASRSSRSLNTPTPGSVVGILHSRSGIDQVRNETKPAVDFLEIRLDLLPLALPRRELTGLPLPLLLTPRSASEGGSRPWSDAARLEHLTRFLPVTALVDWEWEAFAAARDLPARLHDQGIGLVASLHDFSGTPPLSELLRARDHAFAAGADIFKVASTLHRVRDLNTLLSFQERSTALPVASMGMGPLGRASRLLCAALGSVLNYGWLDRPQVPGQFPARLLRARIREVLAPQ